MALDWYALLCKPRKEEVVCKLVKDLGIPLFFPRLRVNPVNPRSPKIRPFFPGYLFIRLNLGNKCSTNIQWIPHTVGLVSYGGEPASVPEHLIIAVQQRIAEANQLQDDSFYGIRHGDVVYIHHGPFKGYDAIFDTCLSGSERVRVLLTWINARQIPVELNISDIRSKH